MGKKFKDIEAAPFLSVCAEVVRQRHHLCHVDGWIWSEAYNPRSPEAEANVGYIGKSCLKTNKPKATKQTVATKTNRMPQERIKNGFAQNNLGTEGYEFKGEGWDPVHEPPRDQTHLHSN